MGWGAEGVEAGYQKRSLGSEAWEERTVGLRQRRDQQGGWVLQEITRRPPGTALSTHPCRQDCNPEPSCPVASVPSLSSWESHWCKMLYALFIPAFMCYVIVTAVLAHWQRSYSRHVGFSPAGRSWGIAK